RSLLLHKSCGYGDLPNRGLRRPSRYAFIRSPWGSLASSSCDVIWSGPAILPSDVTVEAGGADGALLAFMASSMSRCTSALYSAAAAHISSSVEPTTYRGGTFSVRDTSERRRSVRSASR